MVLFLLVFCSLVAARAQSLSINLKQYGFAEIRPKNLRMFFMQSANGQVSFVGPLVAVSFVHENSKPELTRRDSPGKGMWLFRTAYVDPKNPGATIVRDWWTASPDNKLIPLSDGRSLIVGGGQLRVYGATGREEWKLELPSSNVWRSVPYGEVLVSPTRRTLGLLLDVSRQVESVAIMSTANWEPQTKLFIHRREFDFRDLILSDDEVAYTTSVAGSTALCITKFNGTSATVLKCAACDLHFWFLGADRLAVEISPGVIVIVRDSEICGAYSLSAWVGDIHVATGGRRLLALLEKRTAPSGWLDSFPSVSSVRLSVRDSRTLAEVYGLDLETKHHRLRGYAINADGSEIAYLQDDTLHIVSIGNRGEP